jgi:leucyl-tRNA synthetase
MDTVVDSSWYYLRYVDSRNSNQFADLEKIKQMLPVDLYLIGPEHIVLHLLYSRFFTKFLRDEGYLGFDEPFMKMRHQGMILGPDGKKMSKSKGNVITPDEIIEKYGADTLRVYEMFMGPLESDKPWDTGSVIGIYRFLQRIYQMSQEGVTPSSDKSLVTLLHQTIKKVTEDIPALKFNTAIAALMIFMNEWESTLKKTKNGLSEEDMKKFIKIIAPFAPFISEEIYHSMLGTDNALENSVHISMWPSYNPTLIQKEVVQVAVQVNGKLRGQIDVETREIENTAYVIERAKEVEQVAKWLNDKKILKEVYVKGKILNFVVQ